MNNCLKITPFIHTELFKGLYCSLSTNYKIKGKPLSLEHCACDNDEKTFSTDKNTIERYS